MLQPAGRQPRNALSHPFARRTTRDKKFIPDSDSDFAFMAKHFAETLLAEPARYHVAPETAQEIAEAARAYRTSLAANMHRFTKSLKTAHEKSETRQRAERLIRDAANLIRANRQIDPLAKQLLKVKERSEKPKRRTCPQTPPEIAFVGRLPYASTADGTHVIRFRDPFGPATSKARPKGAVRLELFVDLVPPGEPIPEWPGERWGGRTWYLRSFTRSPIKVEYPKCDEPMRVVYWACWADAAGERGPFSATLATRVEGRDRALPQLPQLRQSMGERREQTVIITSGHRQLPEVVNVKRIEATRLLPDESGEAA